MVDDDADDQRRRASADAALPQAGGREAFGGDSPGRCLGRLVAGEVRGRGAGLAAGFRCGGFRGGGCAPLGWSAPAKPNGFLHVHGLCLSPASGTAFPVLLSRAGEGMSWQGFAGCGPLMRGFRWIPVLPSAGDAGSSGILFMEVSHAQAGLHQLVEQLSNRELPV